MIILFRKRVLRALLFFLARSFLIGFVYAFVNLIEIVFIMNSRIYYIILYLD